MHQKIMSALICNLTPVLTKIVLDGEKDSEMKEVQVMILVTAIKVLLDDAYFSWNDTEQSQIMAGLITASHKLLGLDEEQSLFLDGVKIFISWTPTMAVYLFRKKLCPNQSIKDVFKSMFVQRLNIKLFCFVIGMEVGIYFLASVVTAVWDKVSIMSQWSFSWDFFVYSFIICLFTGATGEESGWHGFLFPHLMEKYGCIKSSIYVGIIWGLWHIPLWLISRYTGIDLLFYIVQFMICTIAWSIVMDILYFWNRNLLIVTTFHFMVNFLLSFFHGNDLVFQDSLCKLHKMNA